MIPGNYTLWKYESSTDKVTVVGTGMEDSYTAYDFVSGAAVCGNSYFASAVEAGIDYGLLVADLDTGAQKVYPHSDFGDLLIHNIWCDSKDISGSSVYAVESTLSDPEFTLHRISIGNDMVTNEKVGVFTMPDGAMWAGHDTMFQATASTGEVWASVS